MKMDFSVQTPNLNNEANRVLEGEKEVLFRAMVKMEELAKLKAPVDRGMLKARIHLTPLQRGAITYTLSDGVVYGVDLEYGNRPHNVPLKPLIEWVKRKVIASDEDGQIAFAKYVQEKIRKEGVNAQPFFRPALHEVQMIWLPIIKKDVL